MNHRRRSGRWWRRFVSVETEDGDAVRDRAVRVDDGTPEDLAAHGQLRDAIRHAIRALPRTLRDALLLAQSGEYTYEEIGAMLKAPTARSNGASRRRGERVRQHLATRGHK